MVLRSALILSIALSLHDALAITSRGEDINLRAREEKAASQLIVRLKDGATPDSLQKPVPVIESWNIVPGFMVNKDEVDVDALRADPNVLSVKENRLLRGLLSAKTTQDNAPWGLGRLNVRERSDMPSLDPTDLDFDFEYDDRAGQGVDIYVADTGVRTTHQEFGARARWGWWGNYTQADGLGHGTHIAAIAAGTRYGVAKAANIIAVKIISDNDDATVNTILQGLDYIERAVIASGRPSVINMSLGFLATEDGVDDIEEAVKRLVAAGSHVVVAAGNEGQDASTKSPARLAEVVTVGASNIADRRPDFSNYGTVVDIYAPGQNITSAHNSTDSATVSWSGTSQATAHISGLVAYLISTEGRKTPRRMKTLLTDGYQSYSIPIISSASIPSGKRLLAQIEECDIVCWWDFWWR